MNNKINIKKEKIKCKICNKEYTCQMLKSHLNTDHNLNIKEYLNRYYNISINDLYDTSATLIYVKEFLEKKYNSDIKSILQKLYIEYGTYSKLNNFLGFKCNEHLLYLGIEPSKKFSSDTRKKMSTAYKNREINIKKKNEKIENERKNNKRMICKICSKEYNVTGLSYHLTHTHKVLKEDYLYNYYNIKSSNEYSHDISFSDIYIIEQLKNQFNEFDNLTDLFQYLYDTNESNYDILNKKYNHNIGKICSCFEIKKNKLMCSSAKKRLSHIHTGKHLSEFQKSQIKKGIANMPIEKRKKIYEKISKANTGRHHTREAILKIIKSKENQKVIYRGKAGYRDDIGHYVRSTWEANYARILKYLNIEYTFEKEIFWLDNNGHDISYMPDFKIKDVLIEVKGRWFDDAKEKFKLFKEQYPDMKIIIIDTKEYNRLKKTYKNLINNWE